MRQDFASDAKFEQIEELMAWLNAHKGHLVQIYEQISSNGENFDRHFTTSVRFSMRIASVSLRFSGARLMCMGQEQALHEIGLDGVYRIEKGPGTYCIFEQLAGSYVRKSVLTNRGPNA